MPDRAPMSGDGGAAGRAGGRGTKKPASGAGTAGRGGKKAAGSRAAKTAAGTKAVAKASGQAVAKPDGQGAAARQAAGAGAAAAARRLGVRKTYKLFIGGAFPRSESARSYPVTSPDGELLGWPAQASRKDARDAVRAARSAQAGWAGATAYNRGQVLYRVAEMIEGRQAQFSEDLVHAEGLGPAEAALAVAAAIDRWVWYAGWPDKVAQVAGAANPVAGPYFNFSVPEPTGVVAVLAPQRSSLLGLVSVIAPVIATGNTAVVVASEQRPLPAITLAEVLATSDVPAGVVNVLTGRTAELAPVLAAHMDVNALDLTGAEPGSRAELERLAAASVKRLHAGQDDGWAAPPGPARMLAFLETKTVWHPVGI